MSTDQIILIAWEMAISNKNPKEWLLSHSDWEIQYTSYKFANMIESGWFELDSQGNHVVDLVNISYFDNSFKSGDTWINYSQLVTADIAPAEGAE